MSITMSEQEKIRRDSLNELIRIGILPYPPETFEITTRAVDIRQHFPEDGPLPAQSPDRDCSVAVYFAAIPP